MEVAASIAGISDVSVKILRLLHHIYDDTHGIRSSLRHLNQSIQSLRTVLEELEEKAADPSLSSRQRQLLCIASTTAHACRQLLDQLQTDVPTLDDDASLGRRAYAALLRSINDASIREKQELIDRHLQSLNVSLLVIQRLSIESVGENVARLLGQLTSANTAPVDNTNEIDMDEYSERGRRLVEAYQEDVQIEGGNDFLAYIRARSFDKLGKDLNTLALQGRFLQAAEKINKMISSQRDLPPRQDNDSEEITRLRKEIPILKERQADLLLQCSTVWCHWQALNILQDLVSKAATDRERAILHWKIGTLHAVPEFLGDNGDRNQGRDHLNMAISLSLRLTPFPLDVFCSATQLLVRVFRDSGDDLMADTTEQEMRTLRTGASGPINWQEDSEVHRSAALEWCATKGYPVKTQRFRYSAPVEDGSVEGSIKRRTPLHVAAREGNEEVVKEMLAEVEGDAVDVRDSSSSTPLMEGAKACHFATVKTLLAHGAKAHHADAEGRTALHWAANQERTRADGPAVVTALLAQGASELVDRRDDARGETALHLACRRYQSAIVDCLLAHDADPNITNRQGQSPLLNSIGESDKHTAKHRGIAWGIARALLAAGADPNVRDVYKNTALSMACLRRDIEAVGLLLDRSPPSLLPRPSTSSFASSGTSASASTISTTTTVRPLILTDVNQRGKRGQTPLIIAVNNLDQDIVKKLRKHGANPAMADQDNYTAWDRAERVGTLAELRSPPSTESQSQASIADSHRTGRRLRRWFTLSGTS